MTEMSERDATAAGAPDVGTGVPEPVPEIKGEIEIEGAGEIEIAAGPSDDGGGPAHPMTRAARERARRARDRLHQMAAVGVALTLGAVATFATSPRNVVAHRRASPTSTPARNVGAAHTVLVAHFDRNHRIDLAALVSVAAGQRSGSFVFLPPPTVVDVPALELQPIASLLRVGNRSLLINVIENATGARVDQVALLSDTALARAFAVLPSLDIDLPHPLRMTDSAGSLAFAAGIASSLAPSQAVRLLLGKETEGTLAHLATAQAVLQSYFNALRRTPLAARRAAAVVGAAPFATLSAVLDLRYDVLPVTGTDAAGGERFEIRQADVDQLVRAEFGFARLAGQATRPRIELLNGVGVAGLTQRVSQIVVPAGGHVTLTNNVEGFGERTTRVVYYDDSQIATARRFAKVLGAHSVVKGAIPLDIVDITVVIGSDFVKTHR